MCTNSLKSVIMGLIEKKKMIPYSLFILIMFHICDQYTANALITSTRDEKILGEQNKKIKWKIKTKREKANDSKT